MSLDALLGKPVPIPPVATHVPDREDVPDLDEIMKTMSVEELHRAMKLIKSKRLKLDIVGGHVGSGHDVTARNTLLTGV